MLRALGRDDALAGATLRFSFGRTTTEADIDEAAARKSYNRMFLAYLNVYARLGLKAIPVKADPGPIGAEEEGRFEARLKKDQRQHR